MGAAVSLKFGILGLLAEQPLHGYDVKNRFESLLGGSWEVNFGQVYMTMQRLERGGLIEADGERGDRRKMAYRLADRGRQTPDEWLCRPASEPQPLRQGVYLEPRPSNRPAGCRPEHLLS